MRYTMADIGLSAFSLFFMQSPSFLAHQRRLEEGQGRSNCQTLFGLDKIPSDNHVRALLDPVSPDHFHPVFAEVVTELERSGGLEAFRQLGGSCADRPGRHGIPRVGQGSLPAVLDPQARQGQDRALPRDGVGDARGARPQPGGAAGAGIHRASGRSRQAGLRKPGGSALAGAPWPAPCPAEANLSGRRPVLPPAGLRSGAGGGRTFPVRVQARRPTRRSRNTSPASICRR